MTTTFWVGNQQTIAQVDSFNVTAVAGGATIAITINLKSIVYTCTAGDTTASAATNLTALLQASTVPPEFQEIVWSNGTPSTVTATAGTPGTPFTITHLEAGGSAVSQVHTTANSSPSDVGAANNWLRGGSPGLPQNTDDVIVADSSTPLLWNLTALAAIQFGSYQRWQSFTGTVGLPEENPLGYYEYRPTYFKFVGSGTLTMTLGIGAGSGPSRERYDLGAQRVNLNALASGSPQDDYAIRFLGSNANNVINVQQTSVGVAMLPGEAATVASATVDGGATLALGAGVTFSGLLAVNGGAATLNCAPGTVTAVNGSAIAVGSIGLTYAAVNAFQGSRITWNSDSTITTLVLQTSSTFDKSGDIRPIVITNSTIDGDSCQVLDPLNSVTWTNAASVHNSVTSGPFTFTGTRTVKIV